MYFPNIDIHKFNNDEKRLIEKDIAKDFNEGFKGIQMLNNDAKKGVFLAYKYYSSLFHKIKKVDAKKILNERIRISNTKKILILISSQIQIKLGLI